VDIKILYKGSGRRGERPFQATSSPGPSAKKGGLEKRAKQFFFNWGGPFKFQEKEIQEHWRL